MFALRGPNTHHRIRSEISHHWFSHFLSHFLIRTVLRSQFLIILHRAQRMAEASGSSSKPKKSVPPLLSDLLDLAIFSFACQSGLRSHHKIRGDPVVEGVAAFFGRLISCSNPETLVEFDRFSPARLGKWEPQTEPTKELRTLISSRLKIAKSNEAIREWQPSVPSIVHDKKQSFSEAEDRVKTKFFPKCWRCSRRCAFCIAKKKNFPKFGNFNTE